MGQANATLSTILTKGKVSPLKLNAETTRLLNSKGMSAVATDLANIVQGANANTTALSNNSPSIQSLDSIQNADITFSGANGSISITQGAIIITGAVLNQPNIVEAQSFTSKGGTSPNEIDLSIVGGVINILGHGTNAGHGNITMDGVLTAASIVASGLITAASVVATGIIQAATIVANAFTASGLPGISVTATVRNAAGSGTSSLVVTDGIITGYTP